MDWPQLSDHVIDASYRGLGIIYCTPSLLLLLTYNLPLSKVCKPTRSRSYSYFTCNPIKHQVKLMHDWPSDLLPIFGLKNRRCICRSRFSLGHKYNTYQSNRDQILETSKFLTEFRFILPMPESIPWSQTWILTKMHMTFFPIFILKV